MTHSWVFYPAISLAVFGEILFNGHSFDTGTPFAHSIHFFNDAQY
jgi:hypothetical protein